MSKGFIEISVSEDTLDAIKRASEEGESPHAVIRRWLSLPPLKRGRPKKEDNREEAKEPTDGNT